MASEAYCPSCRTEQELVPRQGKESEIATITMQDFPLACKACGREFTADGFTYVMGHDH
jgi:uncharacterized Zn finger protein